MDPTPAPNPAPPAGPRPAEEEEDYAPRARRPPIAEVENEGLTEESMIEFIRAAVDFTGLVGHNTAAFNSLLDEGIPKILTQLFAIDNVVKDYRDQTKMDKLRDSVRIRFRFTAPTIGRPVYATYPAGNIKPLYPNEARLGGRPYAAPLSLGAEVELTAYYTDGREETKRAEIPPFQVAPIPVMVGSNRCHTHNLTREARKALEEDPNEGGGYFLAKGGEWVVDWLENIRFNALNVYERVHGSERVRGDFISQPGGTFENSSQVIIRYMNSGALTIEINSTKFSKSRIPFFIIYRILGMTSDRDILESIVYDPEGEGAVAREMGQIVGGALRHRDPAYAAIHHELDREKLTENMAVRLSKFVTNRSAYKNDEHAVQYLNDNLLRIMDRIFLPHMGRGPEARPRKLRYLGMLIHKTLLVYMGILEPTDRDSLENKRVHGAGVSIAKAFKTQFNNSVVNPVLRSLKRLVRNAPFEELTPAGIADAFKNPVAQSDLQRTLIQAITSGNSTIVVRRRAITNRVSSQALERKNPANYYSALRTVSTHNASQASKQTERADRMRRVHPTYAGYICVAKSADTGETVGLKKELGITAGVCSAGEALPLKMRLLADPAVTPLDRVPTPDIARKNLAMVFVDGEWIGCCAAAHALVARYRRLRREGRYVGARTSIVWNPVTDDVNFLLDVGRLVRPLLIVDSNIAEYDAACAAARAARAAGDPAWKKLRVPFVQNTRLTPAHVAALRAKRATLEDLRREGVVEWITPSEATNCLVAPSLGALRRARHDVARRYTHVDVEQAIFGLTALLSPFANHTQPARVTYETNQGRQAGGWYCSAHPFRVDKNRFFQWYCETPLVRTLAYDWLPPNGINTVVAYMINRGYNQEDSAVVSKAFVEMGGFGGAFYRYEKAELEKNEFFGDPDLAATKNLKPNASYEKLVDGFVPVGAVVAKGDVLIGRFAKIQAGGRRGARTAGAHADGFKFIDRCVVYHRAEPAVVDAVYRPRGPNDSVFGLVKLRYRRPLGVGDKMSSRAGNKSIAALLLPAADMPFTEEGLTPDIIINPHSIPSRMTIGQMIETSLGLRCQAEGAIADGTAFRRVSLDEVSAGLAEVGLRANGLTRLYNGQTGEYYDAAIFMGPTYHQRLQKFVKDDEYAVGGHGPTDALTAQPLEGKNARGGLRLGEMEAWVLQSHGASAALTEKMFKDSDGRKEFVCRPCGTPAIYNARRGIYRCTACGDTADIAAIDSCTASIAFRHEMRSANVKTRLALRPREFEFRPGPAANP